MWLVKKEKENVGLENFIPMLNMKINYFFKNKNKFWIWKSKYICLDISHNLGVIGHFRYSETMAGLSKLQQTCKTRDVEVLW